MPLCKDIWRVGIISSPVERLCSQADLEAAGVVWLPPEPPLCFLADPFGVWRDDRLHIFVERYDYRVGVGSIEVLVYDRGLRLLERGPALSEPWHLSYPFVFEAEGETWMLPEAFRSGGLTLYRALEFPYRWEPAHRIDLSPTPIDATPVRHEGLWWLFYAPATSRAAKVSELHAAWARSLSGPWTPHRQNPVRVDRSSTRPGGRPIILDGMPALPVQDCRSTYGGAIRLLQIRRLTPDAFEAEAGPVLRAPPAFAPTRRGFHTLSGAGPVTLIDAKRLVVAPATLALDVARRMRRFSTARR